MTATETQLATDRIVELATYDANTGPRRIVGQRIDGTVQLRDQPTNPPGRVFAIEGGLHAKSELDATVADYLYRARQLGYPPMFSLGW